ncbi:nicotinate-nucleotide adenylyltransferase [Pseudoalteromonas rubra]|uniref:Probable nicotinate-nucleotide adenylyltransferase n=1 Tax=Pseudoalteromonas rubra TaxID=43658 RepID=A0A5S3WGK9_9GAMM|nr:nicotinate-nucleotide adenylyltransferase [Pseudoalteromonas rubra]TMP25588.1 nicotinate-nucleotide adenylyltransferase [Pseudoalteromonas rubra]TMP30999.1 nicotinate-nucleotide adenylyltransferase [Pseudoalteromonas rubra]
MIALFGGTFDPIHLGHINMATQCANTLGLSELRFLPNAVPVHKQGPDVSTDDRLAMLQLATAHDPRFTIDRRELERDTPSYSLLTLQEIKAEYPQRAIVFLMGMDSFNSLDKWYRWQEIITLCHIVVYQRPGDDFAPSKALQDYLTRARCTEPAQLSAQFSGLCYFLPGQPFDAASSTIRNAIKRRQVVEPWLNNTVLEYIQAHQLYLSNRDNT